MVNTSYIILYNVKRVAKAHDALPVLCFLRNRIEKSVQLFCGLRLFSDDTKVAKSQ